MWLWFLKTFLYTLDTRMAAMFGVCFKVEPWFGSEHTFRFKNIWIDSGLAHLRNNSRSEYDSGLVELAFPYVLQNCKAGEKLWGENYLARSGREKMPIWKIRSFRENRKPLYVERTANYKWIYIFFLRHSFLVWRLPLRSCVFSGWTDPNFIVTLVLFILS